MDGWMGRTIVFKNYKTVYVSDSIPHLIYEDLESNYKTISLDVAKPISILLEEPEMLNVWTKLTSLAEKANKKYPETSVKSWVNITVSLIIEAYRKRMSTRPTHEKMGTSKFEHSKYKKQMLGHIKTLSQLLQNYPHSDEFYLENPALYQNVNLMHNLYEAIESFKPSGSHKNSIFSDTKLSRKDGGLEGRQRHYVQELSNGFKKFFSLSLHHEVAIIATTLFPSSKAHLTAEDVRQIVTSK